MFAGCSIRYGFMSLMPNTENGNGDFGKLWRRSPRLSINMIEWYGKHPRLNPTSLPCFTENIHRKNTNTIWDHRRQYRPTGKFLITGNSFSEKSTGPKTGMKKASCLSAVSIHYRKRI